MTSVLSRRRFLQALAASVVAAGAALPVGVLAGDKLVSHDYYFTDPDSWFLSDGAVRALARSVLRTKEKQGAKVLDEAFWGASP